MFEIIAEIIRDITGADDITMNTDFIKDLKLNSFDIINMICEFENRYKIKIPTRDVWKLHTVSDAIGYLSSRGVK